MGSLVTAVASYLEARSKHGEWLVRIEDIDPPREIAGCSDRILKALDSHGFEFDPPLFQHTRLDVYYSVTEALIASDDAYFCSCTRQTIAATARPGRSGLIYPGTCRDKRKSNTGNLSVRARTHDGCLEFVDGLQGLQKCRLESESGDFVIKRADGLPAYQLAVVIDDASQGITGILRGIDLLDATFLQIHLQRVLGYRKPDYQHIPVVVDINGNKLSKQTGAQPLDCRNPVKNLFQALVLLSQKPERSLQAAPVRELWAWGIENWNPAPLDRQQQIPLI